MRNRPDSQYEVKEAAVFICLEVPANNHLDLFAVNGQCIIEQCDCRFQPRSEEAVDVVLLDRERYVAW